MDKNFNIFEAPLSGISLVEAGAGTGKTYNIASLYVRSILERELMPKNILVLTFTEAATSELKSRLRSRIKESITALQNNKAEDTFLKEVVNRYSSESIPILKKALYAFDEAQVSTIHGFCQRLISENALEFNISQEFEILTDDTELLQDVTDSYWRDFMKTSESDFEEAYQSFVIDANWNPDKLSKFVRSSLDKEYANQVPSAPSKSEMQELFELARKTFREIKPVFDSEKDAFWEVFESGILNGKKYNDKKFENYFTEFSDWLESDIAPLKPFYKINLFSNELYDAVNKGYEISTFKFTSVIDKYRELCDDLSKLELTFLKDSIDEIKEDYNREKNLREVLTYNDLLSKVAYMVNDDKSGFNSTLRKKYPVALIDEFQDTDPIQYSIFKGIYNHSESTALFMIGDPKQAIYSFRGADIYTYLVAKKDADQDKVYPLLNNYRSNPAMIDAVNTFFSMQDNPFYMDGVPFRKVYFPESKDPVKDILTKNGIDENPLQFLSLPSKDKSAGEIRKSISESVTSEILNMLSGDYKINGDVVKQSDIAILVDSHIQAAGMQKTLREYGIKSVVKSRNSVYSTRESDELYLILNAIHDLTYEDQIRAALTTELIGFHANDISEILLNDSKWNMVYEQFRNLNQIWRSKGFSEMIERLIHEFRIEKKLGKFFDAERRITNLNHLIELLKKAEQDDNPTAGGLINIFKKRRADSTGNSDEEMIRLESDEDLVQIVTIHASKGLEYPIVFCPYLWKNIKLKIEKPFTFHEANQSFLDIGSVDEQLAENRIKKGEEDLAEEIRLTYVALTRAESACFVYVLDTESEFSSLSALTEGQKVLHKRLEDKINESTNFKKLHTESSFKMPEKLSVLSDHKYIEFRPAGTKPSAIGKPKDVQIYTDSDVLNFERNDLQNVKTISSFSALSQSQNSSQLDMEYFAYDYDELKQPTKTPGNIDSDTVFGIPKGAKTGTLLHNIFEEIDFQDPSSFNEVIDNQFDKHGFPEVWKKQVSNLIINSLKHELIDDLSLSNLRNKDLLVEMEFHFPVQSISANQILKLIRSKAETENTIEVNGFLKGFIDLTFSYKGKYYILDYKSNHLGDKPEDYSNEALRNEIEHAHYDLQYFIYTVALNRYLNSRLPQYKYDKDFGGVIYLFLRGIQPHIPGSGVYYDRPDPELILSLDKLMRGKHE